MPHPPGGHPPDPPYDSTAHFTIGEPTRMRNTAVDLPDDPTPEQVHAWVEPAEMVSDPRFRARMRRAAEEVPRNLFGDTDRAAVLERVKASHDDRLARYRELLGTLKGTPVRAYAEEFAWVVAALEARTAS